MKRKITIYTVALVIILLILKMTFGYKKIFYTEIEEKNGIYMYMDKKLSGRVKGVDDYGDVSVMGIFKDGKIVGKYKDYFWANDLNRYCLYKDEKYDKNGLLTGERFEYYYKLIDENQNNVLYKEEFYIDGKKSGQNKVYHRNGNVHYDENYVDGKLEGERKLYYYTGKIKLKANYKNGKPAGNYTWYFENGNVKKQYFYNSNGLQDGLNKEFYDDGSIHREIFYVNGKKDGISKSYYKDGKKLYEGKYEAGNIVEGSTWYKDGSIAIYVDSEKVEEYSPEGFLKKFTDKRKKISYVYNSDKRIKEIHGYEKEQSNSMFAKYYFERENSFNYKSKVYNFDVKKEILLERKYNEFALTEYEFFNKTNSEIEEYIYDDSYNLIALKTYRESSEVESMKLNHRYEKDEDIMFIYCFDEYKYDEKGRLVYKRSESFARWHSINEVEYKYEDNKLVEKRFITSNRKEKFLYDGDKLIKIINYKNEEIVGEIIKEYDEMGRVIKEIIRDYEKDERVEFDYSYYEETEMYLLVMKRKIQLGKREEFIKYKNEYDDLGRLVCEYEAIEWEGYPNSRYENKYYY